MRPNNFQIEVEKKEEVGRDTSRTAGQVGIEDGRDYRRRRIGQQDDEEEDGKEEEESTKERRNKSLLVGRRTRNGVHRTSNSKAVEERKDECVQDGATELEVRRLPKRLEPRGDEGKNGVR